MQEFTHEGTGYLSDGSTYACIGDAFHDLIVAQYLIMNRIPPGEPVKFSRNRVSVYRYFSMRGLDTTVLDIARTFIGIDNANVFVANFIAYFRWMVSLGLDGTCVISEEGRGFRVGMPKGGADRVIVVNAWGECSRVFTGQYTPTDVSNLRLGDLTGVECIAAGGTEYGERVMKEYDAIMKECHQSP